MGVGGEREGGFADTRTYIHTHGQYTPNKNINQAASAAVEKLEALNPSIWAYFASLDFPGNQVCRECECVDLCMYI